MSRYDIPYVVIGVSFDNKEMAALMGECNRTETDRSEVIKQALKYWLALDAHQRDSAIMQPVDGGEAMKL